MQPGKPSSYLDTATPAQPRVLPPPISTHTHVHLSTHTTPPNLKPAPSPPYRSPQQPKPDRKHFARSRSKDVGWRIGRNVNTRGTILFRYVQYGIFQQRTSYISPPPSTTPPPYPLPNQPFPPSTHIRSANPTPPPTVPKSKPLT